MLAESPTWEAPRIHGELLKLGFEISEHTCRAVPFEAAGPCQIRRVGLHRTAIEATVTSDDGKRIEKVAIGKAGNRCIAKRENKLTSTS